MANNTMTAVAEARRKFNITEYPGDLFQLLCSHDPPSNTEFILFKEDISKLSGFIGYGANGIAVICVNYKRPIGHQNFTVAHELGHYFLHRGKSISDDGRSFNDSTNADEYEANSFAIELLYPRTYFECDYKEARGLCLFNDMNRKELGNFVDFLCRKYCLSFEVVLRKLLFENRQLSEYKTIYKEIVKSIGGKISSCYNRDFYVPNEKLPVYQRHIQPYKELSAKLDYLVDNHMISLATSESIKIRNGIEFEQ